MTTTELAPVAGFQAGAPARRGDLHASHAHCVFRRGSSWFAFPVESVREVMFRPPIVPIPLAGTILVGLCHIRSDFLPVLNLHMFLAEDVTRLSAEKQLLVMSGVDGDWGLLVDQVVDLESLEISLNSDADSDGATSGIVVGWATYRDQVVRVLDPIRFDRFARQVLQVSWRDRKKPAVQGRSDESTSSVREIRHSEAAETMAQEIP